ncbi:MAG: glucose-6-phosphate isomerase, partial [Gemmatimonadota bacterium]
KVIMFLTVEQSSEDIEIPAASGQQAFADLAGHTLGELLRTEATATQEALTRAGKPNLSIELPKVGARELGEFFMLWEIATVYAAELYGVNPLDQPGVELSKQLVREKLAGG